MKLNVFASIAVSLLAVCSVSNAATPGLHPDIRLLDQQGRLVIETGAALSVQQTCADCHDSDFIIANHDHPPHIASNCLLCHSKGYDALTFIEQRSGEAPQWASLVGLANTELAKASGQGWQWSELVHTSHGEVAAEALGIEASKSESCGSCHGIVYNQPAPLIINADAPVGRLTRTEGAIYSGQKLAKSGLNLVDKENKDRSFDVHAERLLECTDCHRAANNPVHGGARADNLSHLKHDPRQPDLSAFIERPDHNLVIGVAGGDGNCQGCHEPGNDHTWLPEVDRHFATLACQACHIPELYGPALQLIDYSVRNAFGEAIEQWRGQETNGNSITGFQPLLLPRPSDGKYAPYNVAMIRYWRDAANNESVSAEVVDQAWTKAQLTPTSNGTYLDLNELGALKVALNTLGIEQPELATRIKTYSINHGVTRDDGAIKDCDSCHEQPSLLQATLPLAASHEEFMQPAGLANEGKPGLLITTDSKNQLHVTGINDEYYPLGNRASVFFWFVGVAALVLLIAGWQRLKRNRRQHNDHS